MPLPRISRRRLLQGTAATALATTFPGRATFAKDTVVASSMSDRATTTATTRPTPPAPPR